MNAAGSAPSAHTPHAPLDTQGSGPVGPAPAVVRHLPWLLSLAVCALAAAYVALHGQPAAQAVALQLLCVAPVLGLFTLGSRQVMHLCGLASVALLLALVWLAQAQAPAAWHWSQQGLSGLMVCLLLPLVGAVVARFNRKREHMHTQARLLHDTLAQMQQLATKDPLTGLFNQGYMRTWMAQAAKRARRSGSPLSVAVVNMDHLRAFNERHGHAAADQALCHWAQSAQAVFRQTDVVARWSAEEFVVLFADSTPEQAAPGLARLQQALASPQPSPSAVLGFSAGLVAWPMVADASGDESPDAIIDRARLALRQAKEQGRGRVVVG